MTPVWAEAAEDARAAAAELAGDSDDLPAMADELLSLWQDLGEAHRRSSDHVWSIECAGLVRRIVRLTAASGFVPHPDQLTTSVVLNGLYQGVLSGAGVAFPEPDLDQIAECARRSRVPQCESCGMWREVHLRDCPARPRSQYEIDQ